ncbi:MAG: polyprenyl synthetase family protein [Candidatus Pacebacteria bacterium]|nr:polyprenyl synthetase family protein [Candidatus Paceibacterota bacterium]
MEMRDYYLSLKQRVDNELREFFKYKYNQLENNIELVEFTEIIGDLENFVMSSGKRIRPILFYFGYILAGGENKKEALKTSISVELMHSYFLIHDDIMDRDDFRHGNLSMHCRYKKRVEKYLKDVDGQHFGISMAILAGDLMSSLSYEVLNDSNFEEGVKKEALKKFNNIVGNTIFGQVMDLNLDQNKNLDSEMIFKMQKYKTAKYTIEGPLHLGAILAGANGEFLKLLSNFAIPVGIAFQIQDDIIGVFGNEKKIGKPIGSDIQEGKRTFLITEAEKGADEDQKKILSSALGNKNLTQNELEKVRKVIKDAGALQNSENKAEELIKEAKNNIQCFSIDGKYKKVLNDFTDFIIMRKK